MRTTYSEAQIATACQVMPVQMAAKQPRWTSRNGRAEGYMISSWWSSAGALGDMYGRDLGRRGSEFRFGSIEGRCYEKPGDGGPPRGLERDALPGQTWPRR